MWVSSLLLSFVSLCKANILVISQWSLALHFVAFLLKHDKMFSQDNCVFPFDMIVTEIAPLRVCSACKPLSSAWGFRAGISRRIQSHMNCCWFVNEFSRVLPVFSEGASLRAWYGRSAVDM